MSNYYNSINGQKSILLSYLFFCVLKGTNYFLYGSAAWIYREKKK